MKIILFFKYLPHIAAFSVASVNVLNLAPQNFVFKLFERQPWEAPEINKYPFHLIRDAWLGLSRLHQTQTWKAIFVTFYPELLARL